MISKSCQYALRAVVYVASKADEKTKLNVKQIAREIHAPEAFTAKLLQTLNKHQVITSLKGPYGGFFIEEHQAAQPILNIVHAIDGLQVFSACGLGLKQCSEKRPCPFHDDYKLLREKMLSTFRRMTIKKLAKNLEQGECFLSAV
jgi:Rrf2 family protein